MYRYVQAQEQRQEGKVRQVASMVAERQRHRRAHVPTALLWQVAGRQVWQGEAGGSLCVQKVDRKEVCSGIGAEVE